MDVAGAAVGPPLDAREESFDTRPVALNAVVDAVDVAVEGVDAPTFVLAVACAFAEENADEVLGAGQEKMSDSPQSSYRGRPLSVLRVISEMEILQPKPNGPLPDPLL